MAFGVISSPAGPNLYETHKKKAAHSVGKIVFRITVWGILKAELTKKEIQTLGHLLPLALEF